MIQDLRNNSLSTLLTNAQTVLSQDNLSVIVNRSINKGVKLGLAESITGGMIACNIVSVPGSSALLKEGIVCYSKESKINRLKVGLNTIKAYSAVSEQVAVEMAKGMLNGDYVNTAVSVTGNAGPTTDNNDLPVGTTYICVADKQNIIVCGYVFPGNRDQVRTLACATAIKLLNDFIE